MLFCLVSFFPIVCDIYGRTVDTCSVLLGGCDRSEGEARCFGFCGAGEVEVFLDGEAQFVVVVVCFKFPVDFGNVDFELDLECLPLEHLTVVLHTLKEKKLFAKLSKCEF